MLRNLATSLINSRDERIVTTLPKAKELRPFVERAITLSRHAAGLEGDASEARALHLRRQAAAFFHAGNFRRAAATRRGQTLPPRTAGVAAVRRLFDELGERFKDRPGGYTRIIKLVDNPREAEAQEAARKRTKGSTKKKAAEARATEAAAEKNEESGSEE